MYRAISFQKYARTFLGFLMLASLMTGIFFNPTRSQTLVQKVKGSPKPAEEVYSVYVPTRAGAPGSRVGILRGRRTPKIDHTIGSAEDFDLIFARGVPDLNAGIPNPIDEFAPPIEADGRYFVMWGWRSNNALVVKGWCLLNSPAIRARQRVTVSRLRDERLVITLSSPEKLGFNVNSFAPAGSQNVHFRDQTISYLNSNAASTLTATVLAAFATESGSGSAFLESWTLASALPETPLTGPHVTLKGKFEFRTNGYNDGDPSPPPLTYVTHRFSAEPGRSISVSLDNVTRKVLHQSPTPYRVALVQLMKNGSDYERRIADSRDAIGAFRFQYQVPVDAPESLWQIEITSGRDEAQECAGDLECWIPIDGSTQDYLIAWVDYLHIADEREGLGGGDGEFIFVFAGATQNADEQIPRTFTVRFPAKHHLDVPYAVTYQGTDLQVPFFARRLDLMGRVLSVALGGTEEDDSTASEINRFVHERAGEYFGKLFLDDAEAGRKRGIEDAEFWNKNFGWNSRQTIGPHLRDYSRDEERFGQGFQEPVEFANAGVGRQGESVHYTIKTVKAPKLSGVRVTLNRITVPEQSPWNGGDIVWDMYEVFGVARASDGFYGGEFPAAKRLPENEEKYLRMGDLKRDDVKRLNKNIYEHWDIPHDVPFIYVEFALYDNDNDGYDQLVNRYGHNNKSAIYTRVLLPDEFIIEGHASGSKRIRETRGGITVEYTIEWFR